MRKYAYGHQPSDLSASNLKLGWLAGVRHLKSTSASGSYWHTHEEIQLLYCVRGEYVYEFKNKPSIVLTAGNFIVIPKGLEHRLGEAIDPAGHRVELLVRNGTGPMNSMSAKTIKDLIADLSLRTCAPVACTRELTNLFLELDLIASKWASARSERTLALARTLGTLILHRCADQHSQLPPRKEARLIQEAISWLKNHYAKPVKLERLVAYMGYSRSRLYDIFKQETGLTPADWLSRYRIKRARKELRTSNATTAEIAEKCGFASAQYFNAVFKKQTGVTPSVWRKRT